MQSSNLNELEKRARQKALENIMQEFQKPDQLDKLDHLRKQYERRKNTTEAQLKSAIQGQLDGVRNGLAKLDRAYQESDQIRKRMLDVGEAFQQLNGLTESLQRLNDQCEKHSQLAAAIENMSSLVSVPDDIRTAREHLSNAKSPNLLLAHKIMQKVEGCRDEVMLEIFRSDPKSFGLSVIKTYFANLDLANDELRQQILMIASRILDIIRHEENHGMVVSALRIVDREERADKIWLERSRTTKFMPPGRPKNLKEAFFNRIHRFIDERISGSQLETREETKLWLARHLEVIRRLTVDDLRVVKTLGPIFFPPDYKVFETFAAMYHDAIAEHLEELIEQLNDRELIQVLQWLNTYRGAEMMGSPFLRVNLKELQSSFPPSLMRAETLETMLKRYLAFTCQNIQNWFPSSLDKDVEDWMRTGTDPDSDAEGFFYTSLVVNMMGISNSNMEMARAIGPGMVMRVLEMCLMEFRNFTEIYHKRVERYVLEDEQKELDQRQPLLAKYLVANINNCRSYADDVCQLVNDNVPKDAAEYGRLTELAQEVSLCYSEKLAHKWLRLFVDNIFLCLKANAEALMTNEWMEPEHHHASVIGMTIKDFNYDLVHLRPEYHRRIVGLICTQVIVLYLRAITCTSKRIKFNKNLVKQKKAAALLMNERQQWVQFFKKEMYEDLAELKSFAAFDSISDILKASDTDAIALDVNVLLKNCPDCDKKQLSDILMWREDLGQRQVDEIIEDAMKLPGNRQPVTKGVFALARGDT